MSMPPPLPSEFRPAPEMNGPVRSYLVNFLWVLPALLAWFFCQILIVPKLQQAWFHGGMMRKILQPENSGGVRFARWTYALFDCSDFMMSHMRVIFFAVVASFALLELFAFRRWPKCRRPCLGMVTYSINALVILALVAMVTMAVIFMDIMKQQLPATAP